GEPAEFILPDGGLFRGFLLGRALGKKTKKSHGLFPYYRESRACLLARRAVLENISMRIPVSSRRPTARRPAVSSRCPRQGPSSTRNSAAYSWPPMTRVKERSHEDRKSTRLNSSH